MAGFNPVGSTPVGAVTPDAPSGASYTPATGNLALTQTTPIISGTSTITAVRSAQMVREVLATTNQPVDIRSAQVSRETLTTVATTVDIRSALFVREALIVIGDIPVDSDDTYVFTIW